MREVLEDNFGGPFQYPPGFRQPPTKKVVMRPNSAYMLVYIRQSRVDNILTPVTKADMPHHIREFANVAVLLGNSTVSLC
jgi:ubiquitin carboxyl-terminal hydrolase 7